MVLALRTSKPGCINGLGLTTQLDTQAAAVTGVAYTASAAIGDADNLVNLNHASVAIAATIAAAGLYPGRILVLRQIDSGTAGHTVTLTGTGHTFDGTNNTATFNAQYETLVLLGISDKRFLIILNHGSVGLSSV